LPQGAARRHCLSCLTFRQIVVLILSSASLTSDLFTPISGAYCERSHPGFWGEPLNAMSSLLVIGLAAIGLYYILRRERRSPWLVALSILAVCIGIGSFLLHTFATRWAELLDVIPIWAFVGCYTVAAMKIFSSRTFGMLILVATGFLVFGAGSVLSLQHGIVMADSISGSTQYLPAAAVVASSIPLFWKSRHPSLRLIRAAMVIFGIALLFRSLDLPLCHVLSSGTHFMWHLSNCVVFWLLLRALFIAEDSPEPDRRLQVGA
jgi:hypothetical protein